MTSVLQTPMLPTIRIPNTYLSSVSIGRGYGVAALAGRRTAVVVDHSEGLRVVQRILDEHPDEGFRCSEFLARKDCLLLVLGGELGVIKVLNLSKGVPAGHIKAHGGPIFSIRAYKDEYLLSCSSDTTIKMWSVSGLSCVCVFGGYMGHRDHVLSMDISSDLRYLVSGGSDCSIRVWAIPCSFGDVECTAPVYSSEGIHKFPVRCVRFHGDILVFSEGQDRIHIALPTYGDREAYSDTVLVQEVCLGGRGPVRKFDISGNTLVALMGKQDMAVLDMRTIRSAPHPTMLRIPNAGAVQDFCMEGGRVFVLFESSLFMAIDLPLFEGSSLRPIS